MSQEVVWITGGGTGIGRALALEYARRGACVAISGRRLEKLEEAAAALDAAGGQGLAVRCDVTDEEATRAAVAAIVARWGRLDVAIANAGFGVSGPVLSLSAERWRRQLEINVVGAANTLAAAAPEVQKTRGRLAVVGSVSGFIAVPANGAYTASKFAVRGMVLTLA